MIRHAFRVLIVLSFFAGRETAAESDSFAGATILSGFPVSATGSNVGATAEAGEPDHAMEPATKSVWWRWTSSVTGMVEINTHGSDFDTILAVYTGASLAGLTEIAANDESPSQPPASRVRFAAATGTVYQIAVDGWMEDEGNIVLNIVTATAPPPNDDIANATVINTGTNLPSTVTGTNIGATLEDAEASLGAGQSVWWNWTSTFSGTVEVDTTGSGFDTILSVYRGNPPTLVRMALNDDIDLATSNFASRIRFNATSGTLYRFMVDSSTFSGEEGNVSLTLRRVIPPIAAPANDNFTAGAVLSGVSGTVNGSNRLASSQGGEPDHEGNPVAASVWYRWTPPSPPGRVECLLSFTNGVTGVLGVYTGTAVGSLTPLAGVETSSFTNGTYRARFSPPSGQEIRIAVDGNFGAQESFRMNYASRLPSPPAYDDFSQGRVIDTVPFTEAFTNNYATLEANDNDYLFDPVRATVWFRWTCVTQNTLRVRAISSAFAPSVLVTIGDVATNQLYVADGFGEATFVAVAGTTYHILVGSLSAEEGAFTLSIEEAPALRPFNDNLADAEYLGSGSTGEFAGSMQNATLEATEHTNNISRSVWYAWDAAFDGPAEALLQGLDAGVETRLNVYSGDSFTNLFPLASVTGTNVVRVTFDAAWNTRYALQIADDRPETATSQFMCSVTSRFPVTTFEISDFKRDALGNMMMEWPAVRGVEYHLYAGTNPGSTNNVLIQSMLATQSVMRVACCPPPTNTFDRLFVEAMEPSVAVEPGLP